MINQALKINTANLQAMLLNKLSIYSVTAPLEGDHHISFTTSIGGESIAKEMTDLTLDYQVHISYKQCGDKGFLLTDSQIALVDKYDTNNGASISASSYEQLENELKPILESNIYELHEAALHHIAKSRKYVKIPFCNSEALLKHSAYKSLQNNKLQSPIPLHIEFGDYSAYCDAQILYLDYITPPDTLSKASYAFLSNDQIPLVVNAGGKIALTSILLAVINKGKTEYIAFIRYENLKTKRCELQHKRFKNISEAMLLLSELWFDRDAIYTAIAKYLPNSIATLPSLMESLNSREKLVAKALLSMLVTDPTSFTVLVNKNQIEWLCSCDLIQYSLKVDYEVVPKKGVAFKGASISSEYKKIINLNSEFLRSHFSRYLITIADKLIQPL